MGAEVCTCGDCRVAREVGPGEKALREDIAANKAALLRRDWALVVVPDGGFVVLVTRRATTEGEIAALLHEVPFALRERVLIVDGTRFQASA